MLATLPWLAPAVLLALWASVTPWALPAAAIILATGVARGARQGLLIHGNSIQGLHVRAGRPWITMRCGLSKPVTIRPESRVMNGWAWLSVDDGDRRHTLLLSDCPGFRNTDPRSLRQFRVWLRFNQQGQDPRKPASQ